MIDPCTLTDLWNATFANTAGSLAQNARVRHSLGGHGESMTSIVSELVPHIDSIIRRRKVAPEAREDVRQRVLLELHKRTARLEPMPFDERCRYATAVVCGVAVMLHRDWMEKPAARIDVDELPQGFASTLRSPESHLDRQNLVRALLGRIRALVTGERRMIELVELEERSVVDAAATLGIPAGTAASRLRRAREHLAHVFRVKAR